MPFISIVTSAARLAKRPMECPLAQRAPFVPFINLELILLGASAPAELHVFNMLLRAALNFKTKLWEGTVARKPLRSTLHLFSGRVYTKIAPDPSHEMRISSSTYWTFMLHVGELPLFQGRSFQTALTGYHRSMKRPSTRGMRGTPGAVTTRVRCSSICSVPSSWSTSRSASVTTRPPNVGSCTDPARRK
jgi:hypothetical protein